MSEHKQAWLVRKAKTHYIGPFKVDEIKKLIRESELGAYDEVARSGQPWRYLKDTPPFIQLIEEIIPHADDEQTVRLSDEKTAITEPGVIPLPKKPTLPSKPAIVDLIKMSSPQKRLRVFPWGWGILVMGGLVIWVLWPEPKPLTEPTGNNFPVGEITEPHLKELSETFKQFNLLFFQGKLEESAGEFHKAADLYQQALKHNPDDLKAKVRLTALGLMMGKNSNDLRQEFLKILAVDDLEKSLWVQVQNYLGIIELKEKKYVAATPYFLKAVQGDESYVPAHFNLGYSYFFRKQYYNARKHFDRAVQLRPNMPLIYLYLGWSLQMLSNPKGAIREYNNANRINPHLYLPYLYLSYVYFSLNQPHQATVYLEKMIENDPEYDQDRFRDIQFMQEEFSYRFMRQAYSQILEKRESSATVTAGLAMLHYLDGQKKKALELIQEARRKNLENSTVHTIHGYILKKEGQVEGALQALRAALRYQYQNALALTLMADIEISLGQFEEAIENCRRVIVFEPYSVRAYTLLGSALVQLDRIEEGVDAFNKALEYDSQYMPAKKMLLRYSK